MAVLMFAAVALFGYRLWLRIREAETTIEKLTARVAALELTRSIDVRPARTPEPGTVEVRTPQPLREPPPNYLRQGYGGQAPEPPKPDVASPVVVRAERPSPLPQGHELESRIGSRWLLYVGVIAIVVGVSYFEKLAIENHWVNETWRTIQGGVAGVLLVLGGLRIVKKGYRLYGQILAGTGVALMYVSTYAAFNFYHLLSHPVAFVLMLAITALAAWLADSQRSQGLAVVAVSGGFATPFLLPTGADAEVALFTYDSLLIAATMFLARRRDWIALNGVSYTFTVLTLLSWAAVFYSPSKYLTTEVFLTAFCSMFVYALYSTFRSTNTAAALVRLLLWTAPVGYHALSVANLFDHDVALLIYLLLIAMIGVAIGSRTNAWIRLLFWFAVVVPLSAWTSVHAGESSALTAGRAAWIGIYLLNLAGLFAVLPNAIATFGEADIALLHLNGLATYFGLYLLPGSGHTSHGAAVAAAFAVFNLGCASFVRNRSRSQALHFIALASTFVMIVTALELTGPWITIGWATEGVLVTWLGLHEHRAWLRVAGLAVFAAAVGRLVGSQMAPPAAGQLLLLNARGLTGLFVVVLTYGLAYLHKRYREGTARASDVATFAIAASVLTLSVLTSEINAYWHVFDARRTSSFASLSMRFAREMTLSLTWAVYSTILVIVGLMRKYAPIRYFAMTVFAITIVKVFAVDLSELDRIYRVLSIIGLGVTLLVTSYLYQKLSAEPSRTSTIRPS
jgi:uncharacterized membrane protein